MMIEAAKETCGEMNGRVINPCTIGHEDRLNELTGRVTDIVNRRNECRRELCARRRL